MFLILGLLYLSLAVTESDSSCNNAYCSSCEDTKVNCTACIDNYVLKEGKCEFKRTIGCEKFDSGNSECSQCTDGYKYNFETKKCDLGTETCTDNSLSTACKECAAGYISGLTECVDCSETNKYCLDIEGNDCLNCVYCAPGTSKNDKGVCVLKDEFCKSVGSDGKCYECFEGYYLDQSVCTRGPIPNCLEYESKTICKDCTSSYFVKDGGCIQDPLCTYYNDNKCDSCINGYSVFNGTCEKCSANNCGHCSTEVGKCSSCTDDSYVIVGNDCVKCVASHCEKCLSSDANKCDTCETGYYTDSSDVCHSCSPNCNYCSDLTQCGQCQSGYGMNSTYYCHKCTVENCIKCHGDTPGTCDECSDEYDLYLNVCYKKIDGCEEYGTNSKCTKCDSNFNLETTGICTIKPCDKYDGDKCVRCSKGYFMKNDYTCEKCDSVCTSGCDYSAKNCVDLTNLRNVEKCKIYNKDHVCAFCKEGYYYEDGKCNEIAENCDDVTLTGKCTSCKGEGITYLAYEGYICALNNAIGIAVLTLFAILLMV